MIPKVSIQQQPPNRAVTYWDRVADEKSFTHPVDMDLLARHLDPDDLVLEIGCGQGRVIQMLRGAGFNNVVGTDASRRMVEVARRNVPDAPIHVADGELPLNDAAADGVLLIAVLTCIPSSQDQRALLAEVRRVLRPGGILHVSDYWIQDDDRNRSRYEAHVVGPYGTFALPEGLVLRHHDPAWIQELLKKFRVVSLEEVSFTTMNGNPASGFQWTGQLERD